MEDNTLSAERRRMLSGIFSAPTQTPSTGSHPHPRPMHSPDVPEVNPRSAPPTVPLAILVLNRLGYGPRPGDIDAFNALGATDDERLLAYIEQQLAPELIDDSTLEARIAAANFTTHTKSLTQLWADHIRTDGLPWQDVIRPWQETVALTFNRATYSNRQLVEALTEFWHNHFSVYADDFPSWATMMVYDRDVIRPNVLGNFRTMLGAVAQSASMGFYLDNAHSSADGPNENYARELIELHTLGSEHYYGTINPEDVPGYPSPAGYVEEDVFAVTRALTGWTIRFQWWAPEIGDTGEFLYLDAWHDTGEKRVLGQVLPAGQNAETDGNAVLDILASHSGTAKFIARKLCRRFVADFPSEALVTSTANVFLAYANSDDQLVHVMRHIFQSTEFRESFGRKVKRPFAALVSALRVLDVDRTFQVYNNWFSDLVWWLYRYTGHMPFEWHPPNGYPDLAAVWQSTSSMVARWRTLNMLISAADNDGVRLHDVLTQLPADVTSPEAITDHFIAQIFGYEIHASTREMLIDFMAQGRNWTFRLDMSNEWVQDRVRALVGLMMTSPEFQWR